MRWTTLLVVWLVGTAHAGDTKKTDELTPEAAKAEYVRLSDQLGRLAERGAWPGVERTYQQMQDLGVKPEVAHVMLAAQAARTTGDALAVRERLLVAMQLDPNMDTARWLAELQNDYGDVAVRAPTGLSVRLEPVQAPFQPDRKMVIERAASLLEEEGIYLGLLPKGEYRLGGKTFTVESGTDPLEIDLR